MVQTPTVRLQCYWGWGTTFNKLSRVHRTTMNFRKVRDTATSGITFSVIPFYKTLTEL